MPVRPSSRGVCRGFAPVRRRGGRGSGAAILAAAVWGLASAARAAGAGHATITGPAAPLVPGTVRQLDDSATIQALWRLAFPDSAHPPGAYQAVLRPAEGTAADSGEGEEAEADAPDRSAGILLRDGSEALRFGPEGLEILGRAPAGREGNNEVTHPPWWRSWRPGAWRAWTAWPAGLQGGWGTDYFHVSGGPGEYRRDWDFAWTQELWGLAYAGAGLRYQAFGGGLRPSRPAMDTAGPFFRYGWDWSLSLGVDAVRYTVRSADRPWPEYFWLDRDAARLMRDRVRGRLVRQWEAGHSAPDGSLPGNLAQELALRLGYLRYDLLVDRDAYTAPIQRVALRSMPAGFGAWDMGFLIAPGALVPELGLDLFPGAWDWGGRLPAELRFLGLRLDFRYRDLNNMSAALGLGVRLDQAYLHRPGGRE